MNESKIEKKRKDALSKQQLRITFMTKISVHLYSVRSFFCKEQSTRLITYHVMEFIRPHMVWIYDKGTANKGANFIPFGMTSVIDPTSIEVIALINYTRGVLDVMRYPLLMDHPTCRNLDEQSPMMDRVLLRLTMPNLWNIGDTVDSYCRGVITGG